MCRTFCLLTCLLLAPTVVHAQDRVFTFSEAAVVVAHSTDLAVTQRCLGEGRCRELNPWLMRFNQPVPFAVAKMSIATLGLYATRKIPNRWLGAAVNFGVASAFLAVTAHNVGVRQ